MAHVAHGGAVAPSCLFSCWRSVCCCCCVEPAIAASLLRAIEESADSLALLCPSAVCLCVVHRTGEVVVLRASAGVDARRALSLVPALKRTAAVHARCGVAAIHVHGATSCVHVWECEGTTVLAVTQQEQQQRGGRAAAPPDDDEALDEAAAPTLARLHAHVEALMDAADAHG